MAMEADRRQFGIVDDVLNHAHWHLLTFVCFRHCCILDKDVDWIWAAHLKETDVKSDILGFLYRLVKVELVTPELHRGGHSPILPNGGLYRTDLHEVPLKLSSFVLSLFLQFAHLKLILGNSID